MQENIEVIAIIGVNICAVIAFLIFNKGLDVWGRSSRRLQDWANAPLKSERAQLLKNECERIDLAHPSKEKFIYRGVFQLNNKRRIVLDMEEEQYVLIPEKSFGVINYKSFKLISFVEDC